MKFDITFDNAVFGAVYDELLPLIKELSRENTKAKAPKSLKLLDKTQVVAAIKAITKSVTQVEPSYATYQAASAAMMKAPGPSLKDLGLAKMDMNDYWSALAELKAELPAGKVNEALDGPAEDALTPWYAVAHHLLYLLTDAKFLVKIARTEPKEVESQQYVMATNYSWEFTKDSALASAVIKNPNTGCSLFAEPPSDYDADGFNADGESIYLDLV